MQSGRSGFQICCVFTVRRRRMGVPHAIRASRVSDVPRFYVPAAKDRRAHVTQATRDSGPPRFYGPATKRAHHPTSTSRHPLAGHEQPASSSPHPRAGIQQPTSSSRHPPAGTRQAASRSRHPPPGIHRPASTRRPRAAGLEQPASTSRQPAAGSGGGGTPGEASPTQGAAPLPHAASELGRPSELLSLSIYIY